MSALLNLQIQISLAVLLGLLIRCCLSKLPKRWSYALWILVFLKILIPVSLESPLGIFPGEAALDRIWQQAIQGQEQAGRTGREQTADPGTDSPQQEQHQELLTEEGDLSAPVPDGTGIPAAGEEVQAAAGSRPETADSGPESGQQWLFIILGAVWLAGTAAVLGYNTYAMARIRRRLRKAKELEPGVYLSEELRTPFTAGILKPRIYLPAMLQPEERRYILCHERMHIRRKDNLIKGIAFLLTAVYWYHPLVWVAFYMLEQDMEMSCDEAVVRGMDGENRRAYSQTLLDFAAGRKASALTALTFGENSVKQRVKNILKKKRYGWWCTLIGVLVLAAAAVLLFTTGTDRTDEPQSTLKKGLQAADTEEAPQEAEVDLTVLPEEVVGLQPGDQVAEISWNCYEQIGDGGDVLYLNTRYGIFRKDKGEEGQDVYTCLYPRYIGFEAHLTLHPGDGKLYFKTDSQFSEGNLDWFDNCIMSLDPETLETEIVLQGPDSGTGQELDIWAQQMDAFWGIGSREKEKSSVWDDMTAQWGEDLLEQYELVRSLELDVADCPGDESIEVYVIKEDSELAGMYGGVVRILSADGELLMTETADIPMAGRNALYVGQKDGKCFLMNFYLEDREVWGIYEYQVYRLTQEGEICQTDGSWFTWDSDASPEEAGYVYNDQVFRSWADTLEEYMQASQLLISTLDGEVNVSPETQDDKYCYDALKLN